MSDISSPVASAKAFKPADAVAEVTKLLMDDGQPTETTKESKSVEPDPDQAIENEDDSQVEDGKTETDESTDDEGKQDNDVTWAKVLGVDESDVVLDANGDFKAIKIKINGEEQEVDLKTLKNGFQFEEYTRKKLGAFAEEKKQFEAQIAQQTADFQAKIAQAEQVSKFLEQKLLNGFNQVDWNELRATDPLEYARQWQHFQQQYAELEQIKEATGYESQQLQQMQAEQAMQQAMKASQQNIDRLVAAHPEWSDNQRMIADFNEYGEFYSKEYGIQNEEFAHVMLNMLNLDPRAVDVIRDAMAYRKAKDVGNKKVTNAPKFVKPGQSANTSKLAQLTRAAKTANGAQKHNTALAAVTELLSSGI
jgi:hypothetical protein